MCIKLLDGLVKTIRLQPLFGVFDLIARAPAMKMQQHNGFMGSPTCVHPGGTKQRTRMYLPGTDYPLRTHTSIVSDGIEAQEVGEAVNGIKGRSSLESIVDLVNGIPVDYMHCVLEGVTKKLLDMWITSTRCPCYIGRFVKQIDKNYMSLVAYLIVLKNIKSIGKLASSETCYFIMLSHYCYMCFLHSIFITLLCWFVLYMPIFNYELPQSRYKLRRICLQCFMSFYKSYTEILLVH